MCEPHQSIIQFPENPPGDDRFDPPPTSSLFGRVSGAIAEWGRRVGDFFHLSKMGMGHHEGWRHFTGYFRIPDSTLYEAHWATREFVVDGWYSSSVADRQGEAYAAAHEYAKAISLGDLAAFRRFFEVSIARSKTPMLYVERAFDMFNARGKDALLAKAKAVFGRSFTPSAHSGLWLPELIKPATKMILGLTRHRELLIPAWADDTQIWSANVNHTGL